jgi:uncharacterized integral membrane protein (TIGR00697 family)|tara:strand:- start:291 stop:881 length:591 start_codon:yes stop_codon:yes gene_type:complete
MLLNHRLLTVLALSMGIVVILSNYLVQFPVKHYNLQDILTYGAFSYPIAFLITDLANKGYGKKVAKKIVYLGFFIGVMLTLLVSINFSNLISIRIALGSGTAFLVAQLVDIIIFDKFRKNKNWYYAPLISSFVASIVDTFLFFSISFYNTGIPWVTLALGDFVVKVLMVFIMLVPFRIIVSKLKDFSDKNISYKIN